MDFNETLTNKPRELYLPLTDADLEKLSNKSKSVGLTIEKLLVNFIGDLVHGTYSENSSAVKAAENWYKIAFENPFI